MKKRTLINEVRQLQKIAGLVKEDYQKPTEEHVRRYWETMIEQQPEDVLRVLVDLTTSALPYQKFLADTLDDVFDSYRDELYNDED